MWPFKNKIDIAQNRQARGLSRRNHERLRLYLSQIKGVAIAKPKSDRLPNSFLAFDIDITTNNADECLSTFHDRSGDIVHFYYS